ncbi:SUKH-4 family immunity protein [Streptomyces sp. R08]|uniref:SUKH-4 family immunity protein n=1 Tax=Streptomyces sp. R08 TaxID=3238624 RepID=A0AB39MP59_9ACTN
MPSIEQRLETVMEAPLDTLIASEHRSRPTRATVDSWRLPESDCRELAELGLPDDQFLTPVFQTDVEPALVPNVAGPRERELATANDRLYELGRWGSHDLTPKIGAVENDGRVLAIRPTPFTAADVHPALREVYRDLYHPAVDFINSSIVQLVQISWRWRAAIPILLELTEPSGPCSEEEINSYFARREACEQIVLTGIERIDPAIRADDAARTLWGEVVTDPGC